MGDAATLIGTDLSEARAKTKHVREQLRTLEAALNALANDVAELSAAAGRLERARLNVAQAAVELKCTDGQMSPF